MNGSDRDSAERVTSALLRASQVLVAIATRSLDDLEDEVTLPQYRALVVLATRGPLNLTELAAGVGVHASTASRMCNRLVALGLVRRERSAASGREITLVLTESSHRVIQRVLERRRNEMRRVVENVPPAQQASIVEALTTFSNAADEPAVEPWTWGWPALPPAE
jgi:DNA-binding MarR family transcriptional regulator